MFETMKRMIADAKIRKTTLEYSGRPTTYGVSDVDICGLRKAIQYATDCGIHVIDGGNTTYKGINIIIDDSVKGVQNRSMTTLVMSRHTLVDTYHKMLHLGMGGIYVIRALTDAIGNMTDGEYIKFINNVDKEAIGEYVESLLRSVGITDLKMSKDGMSLVLRRLGSYQGLREVIADGLEDLGNGQKFKKNRCIDCIHCCYDAAGNRYCDKLWRTVPEDMPASEIARLYAYVKPSKKTDNLISQYLPLEIAECEFHAVRR